MNWKRFLGIMVILFAWHSCALVVAPTGGEKDEIPPQIVDERPENSSVNFKENSFEIEFDEFVRLDRIKEQLIVSPVIKRELETKIKGKSLVVSWEDTLKENSSYVFNFGNAIVDITENNPVPDFKYVFSTGTYIDSLSFSGRVIDAFDTKTAKEVLVMLYEQYEDSVPLKVVPNYIGRTNKEGIFSIENMRPGKYKLFALKDENNNYLFDRPDEKIAFDTALQEITESLTDAKLYLFQEEDNKQYVEKTEEKNAFTSLIFHHESDSISFRTIGDSLITKVLHQNRNEKGDTLDIWWEELDEGDVKIEVSEGQEIIDTLKLKVDSFKTKLNVEFPRVFNYFQDIKLKFSRPLLNLDASKMHLINKDSVELPVEINLDSNLQEAQFTFNWEQGGEYNLLILPGAFKDIYGKSNDTITQAIRINTAEEFGNLKVKLSINTEAKVIMQLLNTNGKLLRELSSENREYDFLHLKGGTYSLKLILDENGNGKWDPGAYLKKILPEKVVLYEETIQIRANWDKEINWLFK